MESGGVEHVLRVRSIRSGLITDKLCEMSDLVKVLEDWEAAN
jgi:hypothetical protein